MGEPVNQQISNSRFQYYSDYFAYAANAGIRSAKAVYDAINPAINANPSTFSVTNTAFPSHNTMVRTLESAYEIVYENASTLEPMRTAFTELADHIKKFTGTSLDQYLTDNSIQVEEVYANISGLMGDSVSTSNVK